MHRLLFMSILLFTALVSSSQSDSLSKMLARTVCDCFEGIKTSRELNEDLFGDCIAGALEEKNDLVMQECMKEFGDTTEASAYKLGLKLFDNIKVDLVYDCYDYFSFMDSLRYSALSGLNEDSLKKELKWFDRTNKAPDSSTFYTDRGILKLQLKDINGAYYDLDKAVRLKDKNVSAHLFRGWVLELKKEYAKSMIDYQWVADATGDSNYRMLAAIADRKNKMQAEIKK